MVSVMPPSGVGGLPGFPVGGTTTSRYMETYYPQPHQPYPQVSSNTGKMASYVHYMRSKSAVNGMKRGRPARNVSATSSTSSSHSSSTSINVAVKQPISKCGLQGCTGCQVQTPIKWDPSKGDGGPPKVRPSASSSGGPTAIGLGPFNKPLFVDCSVEYELPMVPKIPPDSQPLLVIHPGWQQKRRITRSSSHLMAAERRQFYCLQCPSSSSVNSSTAAAAVPNSVQQSQQSTSTSSSRKRTYGQLNYSTGELPPPVPAAGMCPLHLLLKLPPWPLVVNMSPKGH